MGYLWEFLINSLECLAKFIPNYKYFKCKMISIQGFRACANEAWSYCVGCILQFKCFSIAQFLGMLSLNKKWSFPLRICLVNVANFAVSLMKNFIFCAVFEPKSFWSKSHWLKKVNGDFVLHFCWHQQKYDF